MNRYYKGYKKVGWTHKIDGKVYRIYEGDRGGQFYLKRGEKIYLYKTSAWRQPGH